MFISILGRWIATWVAAGVTVFITAGFMNNVDELNGDGSVGGGSGVVILGTILGVVLGGASGLVLGFVAAVLAVAILVPYKGGQTTITIAFGVAAVIAAAVTVCLLTGLDPDDAPPTMLTVCVALLIVAMSPWLVSGYISRAEARI